jgi:hypothetical protein
MKRVGVLGYSVSKLVPELDEIDARVKKKYHIPVQ